MEEPSGPPPGTFPPSGEETSAVENAIAPHPSEEAAVAPPEPTGTEVAPPGAIPTARAEGGGGGGRPPAPPSGDEGEGGEEDEEQMVKMSFLEHLEELRRRIIRSLIAVVVGFCACFWYSPKIYEYLAKPVTDVLRKMKMSDQLYFTHPADAFNVFLQIALVAGIFAASPYVLYQVWAFIAPGLYKNERRYAVPFVFFCSTLFIAGGLFGYLVAFPFALEFLLGMGGEHLKPWITAREYLDLFTTIILGLGIIFELPVLILFLSLLRIVSPGFLMRNFRYAVLIITIIAAVVTPTTDVTNLIIFTVPMLALYLLGVGIAWLVTRHRTKKEA